MFAWNARATGSLASGEPSPLLTHLAGEFAPEIAGLWPAPHAVFLTADAPRRHLLCLRLARGSERHSAVVEAILHAPMKAAIAIAVDDAPPGLKRALEHMGEIAWPRAAYLKLLDLLVHPQAAKVLRHARLIEADQVGALASLPLAMLEAGGGKLGLDPFQSQLAAEVHAGLSARDGEEAAQAAARRWGAAVTAKDALELMRQDLTPKMPPPPFVGTKRLRPISSQEELRDAALRYRNCLRDYAYCCAQGRVAIYEWLGDPTAIVEIRRDDLFGWRLAQARLVDNRFAPEATRTAICEELRGIGVHVGRADWQLRNALEDAADPSRHLLEPAEAVPTYAFADND